MASNILDQLAASNMFNLRGVVAVVTGGGSGIGMMITSTLVANGATVYIIGLKQADLDRVAKPYNDAAAQDPSKGKIIGVEGDVRSKTEAERLAKVIEEREGHITVLFNNAGVLSGGVKVPTVATAAAYKEAFFDAVTSDDFINTLDTNSVGPYWLTFAFLPLLEKWKNSDVPAAKKFVPQIVMTSSMNGWTKDSRTGGISYPYLFSKSALGHATSSLAHELLPLGVRVNGIAPGWFHSGMSLPHLPVDDLGITHAPPGQQPGFEIPTVKTGGSSRDMGGLVLFLVANWYVNGETVLIDGGTLLQHPSSY